MSLSDFACMLNVLLLVLKCYICCCCIQVIVLCLPPLRGARILWRSLLRQSIFMQQLHCDVIDIII
jgi:hypothetical protein